MDIISFSEASTANDRISKINANPDSNSGIVTQPMAIATGESVTVPAGRVAVLPNLQVDGTLTVDGEVFVPSGATVGDLENQIALKTNKLGTGHENKIASFDANGNLKDSGVSVVDGRTLINTSTDNGVDALQVSGSVKTSGTFTNYLSGLSIYRDVAGIVSGSVRGTLKITLPKSWSNTMMSIKLNGYNYSSYGAWEILLGGYNHIAGARWYNTSARKLNTTPPFSDVRFGHDGTKCVILLGTTTTAWVYPKVFISEFMASHVDYTYGWSTGWAMGIITDETGIVISSSLTLS